MLEKIKKLAMNVTLIMWASFLPALIQECHKKFDATLNRAAQKEIKRKTDLVNKQINLILKNKYGTKNNR